eukprot:1161716-Pelagomonas_calceolata.AAC.1
MQSFLLPPALAKGSAACPPTCCSCPGQCSLSSYLLLLLRAMQPSVKGPCRSRRYEAAPQMAHTLLLMRGPA